MVSGHVIDIANIYYAMPLHLIPLNRSRMVPSYYLNADIDKCNKNHFQHCDVHGHRIHLQNLAKVLQSSSSNLPGIEVCGNSFQFYTHTPV